ncbi:exopolysaccharide biosynthesis protein, acetyltransferase [Actinobacillus minor NM305]|uniref:Exopolysaccharide biosynthesis protein, acetyltransferase n=1 Tax=Actinobacillus minor NM305 TaxID=637911 RepID=C5S248_9PAST|nr:exopolysaccharide biosynthesis protein, acetyltransferase [Actinobacillus minor NM305]
MQDNTQQSTIRHGQYCLFKINPNAAQVSYGENSELRDFVTILVSNNAKLLIGNNVFINSYSSINCLQEIEIGDHTLIGEGVRMYDHNHKYDQEKIEGNIFYMAPIKIGKHCWIGSNVVILKGVTIGDHCVIGAGCVVHKDIPAGSVVLNKQELIVKEIK